MVPGEFVNDSQTISIVVPVYNVKDELNRCVLSIRQQTYDSLEVILVDDGSTDGSGELCDRYAIEDRRFHVIHKKNGGLSSARNAGLRVATGKWLLYVDSDDAITPDACEGFMEVANDCGADLILGDAVHETTKGEEWMVHDCLEPMQDYAARDAIIKLIKSHEFYAPACFGMYKTCNLKDENLYFVEGLLHEDMEMQPRLFLSACTISYTGKIFYRYIDRSSSIMNAAKKTERANALRSIYQDWKTRFETVEDVELRNVLYGHLAKCYLHSCLELGDINLRKEGINWRFLFDYGLDGKEKAKALLYGASPSLWAIFGGR
jgi:glycosyltransferase involved in cell wall biosynthesis